MTCGCRHAHRTRTACTCVRAHTAAVHAYGHTCMPCTQDAFVVRYDAAGQGGLATHTDDSELSFNLLLSEPADFDGGGTSFEAAGSQ